MEQLLAKIFSLPPLLLAVIIAALIFEFINGWNDAANAIATVVSTKVLSPFNALLLAATMNMIGALTGTAVAKTIVTGLVRTDGGTMAPDVVILMIFSAMVGAIVWGRWMGFLGLPTSSSHALIGGLSGAAVAAGGVKVLKGAGIGKVLLALFFSPIFGGLIAFGLMLGLYWLVRRWSPSRVQRVFSPLQLISCAFMAFNHGLNDAQKVMGIITMALVAGAVQIPGPGGDIQPMLWVKITCGLVISLGTAAGGWKIIRTLGLSLSKLAPIGGFAAETAASVVLLGAATLGIPVSTTHTITGAIMGTGAVRGLNKVRWVVGQKIVLAWVLTLPFTAVAGGFIYWILAIQFDLVAP